MQKYTFLTEFALLAAEFKVKITDRYSNFGWSDARRKEDKQRY